MDSWNKKVKKVRISSARCAEKVILEGIFLFKASIELTSNIERGAERSCRVQRQVSTIILNLCFMSAMMKMRLRREYGGLSSCLLAVANFHEMHLPGGRIRNSRDSGLPSFG